MFLRMIRNRLRKSTRGGRDNTQEPRAKEGTGFCDEQPRGHSAHAVVSTRNLLRPCALLLIAMLVGGLVVWPGMAAVELLQAFTVEAFEDQLHLSWVTRSEYNVSSFEILCKEAREPDTSYHVIHSTIARGDVDSGASYDYTIQSGLEPGKAYCFRLREVTTDDEPGDRFDRCGYGFGITPTPGLAPTQTPILLDSLTPTTTLTVTVFITPTLPPPVSPLATATETAVSPLATPTAQNPISQPPPTFTFTPTVTPVPPVSPPTFTAVPTFTPADTFTPTPTVVVTATSVIDTGLGEADNDADRILNRDEDVNGDGNYDNDDTDQDGIPDYLDDDDDNDGIPTIQEDINGPDDETPNDSDGDGQPDYRDSDDDNDLVQTRLEDVDRNGSALDDDTDNDGIPNYRDTDDDGDGIPTLLEDLNGDNDPLSDDTDQDGIANFIDADDDGDTVSTQLEDINNNDDRNDDDTDGDGIPNYLDNDDDGDGVPSLLEDINQDGNLANDNTDGAIDPGEDTTPDYLDPDDDNDGVPTLNEDLNGNGNPLDDDADGDGIPAFRDLEDNVGDPTGGDSDEDSVTDTAECPAQPCRDTNANGAPDYVDEDDDGDGVLTFLEDVDNDGNSGNDDSDGDGLFNYIDPDDDNDGNLTINEDTNGNGNWEDDDVDGDGIPDYLDPDAGDAAQRPAPSGAVAGSGELTVQHENADGPRVTNGYIVVTYTPTPPSLLLYPYFTPVPTATPDIASIWGLDRRLAFSNENLIAMMLCFTFATASGFGLLGLITSLLYMRSRKRNR